MSENPGEISLVVSPIQLYAMLNGRSISQAEVASNSWHAAPGPSSLADRSRWSHPMSDQDQAAAMRQYLAEMQPAGRAASSAAGASPSRQDSYTHQSHYSQPNAPDCWIPPRVNPPSPASQARFGAVLGLIGGGLEMTGGVLLLIDPDPTISKVAGGALALHSVDVMQAAMRQLFSGRPVEDLTQQGATRAARGVGFSDRAAHRIGVVVDVAVPLVVTAGMAGAARVSAIRAGRAILSEEAVAGKVGRVTLAEEEADSAAGKAGGHTKAQHVDVDDNHLTARGAAAKDPTRFFSRFTDLQTAEDAVNECFRVNRNAMQRWAANPKLPPEFEVDLQRTIGRGFQQSTNTFTNFTKVRVVLRASKIGPKQFFIITSYPIP